MADPAINSRPASKQRDEHIPATVTEELDANQFRSTDEAQRAQAAHVTNEAAGEAAGQASARLMSPASARTPQRPLRETHPVQEIHTIITLEPYRTGETMTFTPQPIHQQHTLSMPPFQQDFTAGTHIRGGCGANGGEDCCDAMLCGMWTGGRGPVYGPQPAPRGYGTFRGGSSRGCGCLDWLRRSCTWTPSPFGPYYVPEDESEIVRRSHFEQAPAKNGW